MGCRDPPTDSTADQVNAGSYATAGGAVGYLVSGRKASAPSARTGLVSMKKPASNDLRHPTVPWLGVRRRRCRWSVPVEGMDRPDRRGRGSRGRGLPPATRPGAGPWRPRVSIKLAPRPTMGLPAGIEPLHAGGGTGAAGRGTKRVGDRGVVPAPPFAGVHPVAPGPRRSGPSRTWRWCPPGSH